MPTPLALPVSATFIALCGIALFLWGAWIGPLRGKLGILRGDGGHDELFKRIRIHGNFAENAPLFAAVLVAAELCALSSTWLWLAVGSFGVGRVYHFVRYDHADRGLGMALTTAPALAMGVYVLVCMWA